ncbi:MAG: hypothetical protein OEO82_01595 [Gammaproteobacteria bacterium]|nr:hypothetical protein [Gammaproteobacteria bacterium]
MKLAAMKNRLTRPLFVTAIAVVLGTTPEPARSHSHESIQASDYQPMLRRTLRHDDIEREYFVYIPVGAIIGEAELPAVVAIHGYTSTATGFQAAHGLNRHADQHGYVVVYPQGSHFTATDEQGGSRLVTSWNDLAANLPHATAGPHCTADSTPYPCPPECGECARCGWTSCHDDSGFFGRMLDAIQAEFPVDSDRIYVLGVSAGGMMALRLGCNMSDRFAAIAPIIGQLAPGHACGPQTDLPMLHLFGGQDEVVRYDGRAGSADGFIYSSAAETAEQWAAAMACKAGPQPWQNPVTERAGLACTAYINCRVAGQEVVSCMDPDGGHAWPEQGFQGMPATCVTTEQFGALPDQPRCQPATGAYHQLGMDLIWSFLSRYRRVAPRR